MPKTLGILRKSPNQAGVQHTPRNGEAGDRPRWNFFIYTGRGSLPSLQELLERDEAGGVGGADAGPAVLHRLVRDGKLAQVVADHLGLQEERSLLGQRQGAQGHPPPILGLPGAWHSW